MADPQKIPFILPGDLAEMEKSGLLAGVKHDPIPTEPKKEEVKQNVLTFNFDDSSAADRMLRWLREVAPFSQFRVSITKKGEGEKDIEIKGASETILTHISNTTKGQAARTGCPITASITQVTSTVTAASQGTPVTFTIATDEDWQNYLKFAKKFRHGAQKGYLYDSDSNPRSGNEVYLSDSTVQKLMALNPNDVQKKWTGLKAAPDEINLSEIIPSDARIKRLDQIKAGWPDPPAGAITGEKTGLATLAYNFQNRGTRIYFWDANGDEGALTDYSGKSKGANDFYWMPADFYDRTALTLPAELPAISTESPAVAKEKSPIFVDALANPERYVFYPLLVRRLEGAGRDIVPYDDKDLKTDDFTTIPSLLGIDMAKYDLPKDGELAAFKQKNKKLRIPTKDGEVYYIDSSYYHLYENGTQKVHVLILPRYGAWCDPSKYITRGGAGIGGYIEFEFEFSHRELPLFMDLVTLLPDEACSHHRDEVKESHTLKVKASSDSVASALAAATQALALRKQNKKPKDLTEPALSEEDVRVAIAYQLTSDRSNAEIEDFIEELKKLKASVDGLDPFTKNQEGMPTWLYAALFGLSLTLTGIAAHKFFDVFGKLKRSLAIESPGLRSYTGKYQSRLKRVRVWAGMKGRQVARAAKGLVKAPEPPPVNYAGQEELRNIIIERARLPRGAVKSIRIVAEPGAGKSELVRSIVYDIATGRIPGLGGREVLEIIADEFHTEGGTTDVFPNAVKAMIAKLKDPQAIGFIDEVQGAMKAGTHSGNTTHSPFIERVLAVLENREMFWITLTTPEGAKHIRETNKPFYDRFDEFRLKDLTTDEMFTAMRSHANRTERLRGVKISDAAVRKAIELSYRLSDKHANRGTADFMNSLVDYVKLNHKRQTEINDTAVVEFVDHIVEEEKKTLVSDTLIEIKIAVRDTVLKKYGYELSDLGLNEKVYDKLGKRKGENYPQAIRRLRRVLLAVQEQLPVIDNPLTHETELREALAAIGRILKTGDIVIPEAGEKKEVAGEPAAELALPSTGWEAVEDYRVEDARLAVLLMKHDADMGRWYREQFPAVDPPKTVGELIYRLMVSGYQAKVDQALEALTREGRLLTAHAPGELVLQVLARTTRIPDHIVNEVDYRVSLFKDLKTFAKKATRDGAVHPTEHVEGGERDARLEEYRRRILGEGKI